MAKTLLFYLILLTAITGQLVSQDTGNWIDKGRYFENKTLIPAINYIKYTRDGKYFYTFGADSTLRKWDVNTGEIVREIKINVENLKYIDVNYNDTKYLVCTSQAYKSDQNHWSFDVYVFDMKTEKLLFKFDGADKYQDATWGTSFQSNFARYHPSRDEIITTYGTQDHYGGYWLYKGKSILFDGKDGSVIRSIDKNGGYFAYSRDNSKIAFIRSEGSMASQSHGDYHDRTVSLDLTDDNLENDVSLGYGYYYEDPYTSRNRGLGYLFLDLNGIAFSSDDAVVYSNCKVRNELIYCFNTNDKSVDIIKTMHDDTAVLLEGIEVTEDGRFITGLVNIIRQYDEPGDRSALYYINTKTHDITDSISFPEITGQNFICKSPDNKSLIFSTRNGYNSRLIIINPEFGRNKLRADFRSDRNICQTGDNIHFFDYSDGNPEYREWDFGDGSHSNDKEPKHVYEEKGTYTVKLITTNGIKWDTLEKKEYITVFRRVKADFDFEFLTKENPLKVQFKDKSDGDISKWSWDFGDSTFSDQKNPIHTYSERGIYDVKLIVGNDFFSDTVIKRNAIKVDAPPLTDVKTDFESEYVPDNCAGSSGIFGMECRDEEFLISSINDKCPFSLFRVNDTGDVSWQQNMQDIEGYQETKGFLGVQIKNGRYIIAGLAKQSDWLLSASAWDVSAGHLWDSVYMKSLEVKSLISCSDGGYALLSYAGNTGDSHTGYLIKCDQNGAIEWKKDFIYSNSIVDRVLETKDGYIVMIPTVRGKSYSYALGILGKDGTINNTKLFDDGFNLFGTGNTVECGGFDKIGDGYVAALNFYYKKENKTEPKLIFITHDMNFREVSVHTVFNKLNSLAVVKDEVIAVTGELKDSSNPGYELYNKDGKLLKRAVFNGREGVFNYVSAVSGQRILLTGRQYIKNENRNVCYTVLAKVEDIYFSPDEKSDDVSREFSVIATPNPSAGETTISYYLDKPCFTEIEIYDNFGRKILVVASGIKPAGFNEMMINTAGLAQGVYFYTLKAGSEVLTGRIVVVR